MQTLDTIVTLAPARDKEKPVIVLVDGREHKHWGIDRSGFIQVFKVAYWNSKVEAVFADGTRADFAI